MTDEEVSMIGIAAKRRFGRTRDSYLISDKGAIDDVQTRFSLEQREIGWYAEGIVVSDEGGVWVAELAEGAYPWRRHQEECVYEGIQGSYLMNIREAYVRREFAGQTTAYWSIGDFLSAGASDARRAAVNSLLAKATAGEMLTEAA